MPLIKKIRFYFSFRSPFAGIAFYRLRRFPQFNDYEIELIPLWPENVFGGHMDNPTDNLFKMAYMFNDAARQAEEAGISPVHFRSLAKHFKLPTELDYREEKAGINLPVENWSLTHHAFLYALAAGKGWAFGDAIFNRRFNFDEAGSSDVMDPQVIGEIATLVGIDADKAMNASRSGTFDEQHAAMVQAGEADGVFGVPFFVIDYAVQNAEQSAEDMPQALPYDTEVFWGNDHLGFLLKALTGASAMSALTAKDLTQIQTQRL